MQGGRIIAKLLLLSLEEDGNELLDAIMSVLDSYENENKSKIIEENVYTRLIYDIVWKEPYSGDYNIVMNHIRNMRVKIEDDSGKPVYIQTVWGVGYRFNQEMVKTTKQHN